MPYGRAIKSGLRWGVHIKPDVYPLVVCVSAGSAFGVYTIWHHLSSNPDVRVRCGAAGQRARRPPAAGACRKTPPPTATPLRAVRKPPARGACSSGPPALSMPPRPSRAPPPLLRR